MANCFALNKNDKIIISLTADHKNINNTKIIINSIIAQNVEKKFYEILLILSLNEFKSVNELPKEIQVFKKLELIRILLVTENLTNQKRTLITMKKYKNNAILIINNKCLLPNGWLKMFIDDHFKYPHDAIAASIQFYYGSSCKIKEISEGYNGEKFGTFNHVTEMIFNFALLNYNLGGILYPKKYFRNKLFYDYNLFLKTNVSEEFWHSSFIIIEDNILRQSSKIFDYTKYLIDNINYKIFFMNMKLLMKNEKLNFLKTFPDFDDYIKKRQNKIIVSITSYPLRFVYLPYLMSFIRNQTFHINNIIFFIYKEDIKYYNLSINDIKIILVDENLKPHLKYFYAMNLYRDHAIITLDDDIGYAKDTFKSLFKAYLEKPNIISGRRTHLMTYKNNGELKGYFEWYFQQKLINNSNFDLTLTNVGGTIFPPDILNINEYFLPIIYETITCDDLTLKYFANLKGIPHKWIFNTRLMGLQKSILEPNSTTLFEINHVYNDICINKLNIMINKFFLQNLCVPYRGIPTGSVIFLFDIHNKKIFKDIIYFELYAYSFCPIDNNINFTINFENCSSFCFINQSKSFDFDINIKKKNASIATCYMKKQGNNSENIEEYYFPSVQSKDNIIIKIYNYRKYSTIIFRDFICEKINNCFLYTIIYEEIHFNRIPIRINNQQYSCIIMETDKFLSNKLPKLIKFKCTTFDLFLIKEKYFVSGIPNKIHIKDKMLDNYFIPNQFIASEIIFENDNLTKQIIINGKLTDNPKKDIYYFSLNILYPQHNLKCKLKANSKFVQSKIYCNNDISIEKNIFIENQLIYSNIDGEEILLINEETFIKINIKEHMENYQEHKKFLEQKEKKYLSLLKTYILLILIFIIKRFCLY